MFKLKKGENKQTPCNDKSKPVENNKHI